MDSAATTNKPVRTVKLEVQMSIDGYIAAEDASTIICNSFLIYLA
jgi:hypothetical protein